MRKAEYLVQLIHIEDLVAALLAQLPGQSGFQGVVERTFAISSFLYELQSGLSFGPVSAASKGHDRVFAPRVQLSMPVLADHLDVALHDRLPPHLGWRHCEELVVNEVGHFVTLANEWSLVFNS